MTEIEIPINATTPNTIQMTGWADLSSGIVGISPDNCDPDGARDGEVFWLWLVVGFTGCCRVKELGIPVLVEPGISTPRIGEFSGVWASVGEMPPLEGVKDGEAWVTGGEVGVPDSAGVPDSIGVPDIDREGEVIVLDTSGDGDVGGAGTTGAVEVGLGLSDAPGAGCELGVGCGAGSGLRVGPRVGEG